MSEIDFLPNRYGEQSAKRRLVVWRATVTVLFFCSLGGVSIAQVALHQQVQHELSDVTQSYARSEQIHARLDSVEIELVQENWRASLYTYLRHPWPRANLVDVVTRGIPREIDLTELQIEVRALGGATQSQSSYIPEDSGDALEKSCSAERDLDSLRKECDSRQTIVIVRGAVQDTELLQSYLADLGHNQYFTDAELLSLETPSSQEMSVSRFSIRLRARPGYGQPRGPEIVSESLASEESDTP